MNSWINSVSAPKAIVASSKEKRTTSIRIDWAPVSGAHKYFASIWPPTTSGLTRIPIYSNFVQLTDLTAETSYVMNLTAQSYGGSWTTDVHTCRFSTGPAMSQPVSHDVTSTTMGLSWTLVPGVDFYEISFSPPINDDATPLVVEVFILRISKYNIVVVKCSCRKSRTCVSSCVRKKFRNYWKT